MNRPAQKPAEISLRKSLVLSDRLRDGKVAHKHMFFERLRGALSWD